jgi:hypothetical protein
MAAPDWFASLASFSSKLFETRLDFILDQETVFERQNLSTRRLAGSEGYDHFERFCLRRLFEYPVGTEHFTEGETMCHQPLGLDLPLVTECSIVVSVMFCDQCVSKCRGTAWPCTPTFAMRPPGTMIAFFPDSR